jgi:Sigma-70, region 4
MRGLFFYARGRSPDWLKMKNSDAIEEVAEIVGIPENTVKTRMFYARKKLAGLVASA